MTKSLSIRVVVPHFFRESSSSHGYGCERSGERLQRSLALSSCLNSLLNLRCNNESYRLNISASQCETIVGSSSWLSRLSVALELHVFVTSDAYLEDILTIFGQKVTIHRVNLENPRYLPHAARDWLIHHDSLCDLNLYFEDDLVVHDPLFPLKILWMAEQTDHKAVLMPHRYELTSSPGAFPCLYIDGPAAMEPGMEKWHRPGKDVAQGVFMGQKISFDCPSNPHSGFFGVSRQQAKFLSSHPLPRSQYIGPLETAATMTVGQHFKILKASWEQVSFCKIQHAHPSFLSYLKGSL